MRVGECMRWGIAIFATLLIAGCAGNGPPAQPEATVRVYEETVATALVFESPLVASGAEVQVDRAGRGPAAYAGFEEIIATYSWVRQDDYQNGYGNKRWDRFERRAVSTKVSLSYR